MNHEFTEKVISLQRHGSHKENNDNLQKTPPNFPLFFFRALCVFVVKAFSEPTMRFTISFNSIFIKNDPLSNHSLFLKESFHV